MDIVQRLTALIRRAPRQARESAAVGAAAQPKRLPARFDLSNVKHVLILDEIRERYSTVLMREDGEFKGCLFRPAAVLPYPATDIRRALEALLAFAEGRVDSKFIPATFRTRAAIETLRACLDQLDYFLDVPPAELPKSKQANAAFGMRYRNPQDFPSMTPEDWRAFEELEARTRKR